MSEGMTIIDPVKQRELWVRSKWVTYPKVVMSQAQIDSLAREKTRGLKRVVDARLRAKRRAMR